MLDGVLRYLACPNCDCPLTRDGPSLRCERGHTFDIARQGYVSLLSPQARADGGDTAAMVEARARFLGAGHYSGIASALADAVHQLLASLDAGGCIVDAGAGTGYYLAAVLDRIPGRAGLALDRSKFALRRAARAHPRVGAAACDIWRRLPVADRAAVAVLDVFAPRNGAELARILHPAGSLFVVTPARDHLSELRAPLGLLSVDERQEQRLTEKLGPHFNRVSRRSHRVRVPLGHGDLANLVAMGPSSWHVDPGELQARIEPLPDPMPTTVSAEISTFRRRADAPGPPP